MRFKLKTLFALVTIVAVICAAPRIWHQIQLLRLKSYVNRNLGSLEERESRAVSRIADSVLKRASVDDLSEIRPIPWFIWRHPNGTLVFLELIHVPCTTAQSHARVTVFNDNGHVVNEVEFSTGYGIAFVDSERVSPKSTTEFLFTIDSKPINGPVDTSGRRIREMSGEGVRRQYYAIVNNQPVLLRLENLRGDTVPNGVDHFEIAPELTTGNLNHKLINRLQSKVANRVQDAR